MTGLFVLASAIASSPEGDFCRASASWNPLSEGDSLEVRVDNCGLEQVERLTQLRIYEVDWATGEERVLEPSSNFPMVFDLPTGLVNIGVVVSGLNREAARKRVWNIKTVQVRADGSEKIRSLMQFWPAGEPDADEQNKQRPWEVNRVPYSQEAVLKEEFRTRYPELDHSYQGEVLYDSSEPLSDEGLEALIQAHTQEEER